MCETVSFRACLSHCLTVTYLHSVFCFILPVKLVKIYEENQVVGVMQVSHLMLHVPGRIMPVDIFCVSDVFSFFFFMCPVRLSDTSHVLLASLVPVLSLSNLFILEMKL